MISELKADCSRFALALGPEFNDRHPLNAFSMTRLAVSMSRIGGPAFVHLAALEAPPDNGPPFVLALAIALWFTWFATIVTPNESHNCQTIINTNAHKIIGKPLNSPFSRFSK